MASKSFGKEIDQQVERIRQTQPGNDESPKTEVSAKLAEPADASHRSAREPVTFDKFTFPLRADLRDRLAKAVATLTLEKNVEVSKAVLIRLGIESVLDRLEKNPDALLKALYQLEQKEVILSGDKKYSVNRGLLEYIQSLSHKPGNT